MNTNPTRTSGLPCAGLNILERSLRGRLLRQMGKLRECEIVLNDALGHVTIGSPALPDAQTLRTRITVHDPGFYYALAANGSVGAGEAYMRGHWSCDDLTTLVRILVRNRAQLDAMESGLARLGGFAMKAWHALRRNTREGSQRNVTAHYDLGNEFFRLFLDDKLMYSSAIFLSADDSLEQASAHKLDRICQKIGLQPHDHVLEIGTGWGGFALHAAKNYRCRVTTTTISRKQYEMARQRVQEAGLGEQVTVLCKDYRDLDGQYDKLVSIEMIEAVGHQYLPAYFRQVSNLLKETGCALIQAITIEDQRYQFALKSVDFIKRYIFPGSFIPSINAISEAIAHSSDMNIFHLEDIGASYALTLQAWRNRFLGNLSQVRNLGFSESFIRMWEFYFCYCEGGFRERSISNVQLLLAKPRWRSPDPLTGCGETP